MTDAFMRLTPDDQRANDEAAVRGHKVAPDPIEHPTAAKRWTCTECGLAILLYGGHTYGGCLEYDCVPAPHAGGPPVRQTSISLPAIPDVTVGDFERLGIDVIERDLTHENALDEEGRIDTMSWDEAMSVMLTGASAGAAMFQRFVCEACRAIQTMPTPNHVYSVGRCEECAHLTDLRRTGFGVYGIVPRPGSTAATIAKFDDLVNVTSAEIRSRPDNFVLRARGVKVKSHVHRAPCRNCGQPDHRGKPCEIRFLRARQKMR